MLQLCGNRKKYVGRVAWVIAGALKANVAGWQLQIGQQIGSNVAPGQRGHVPAKKLSHATGS